MALLLEDKVAIVTGAGSGNGAATARELARRGARVVLAARRTQELEKQVYATIKAGGRASGLPTNITDVAQATKLVEHAAQTFGRVNVLVNNAGSNWVKPFAETSTDELSYLLQVKVR